MAYAWSPLKCATAALSAGIIGNFWNVELTASSAAYFTSLAGQGASFSQSYAITHPSQPNYIALFSGSTQGVTNDDCPKTFSAGNLGALQLQDACRTLELAAADMQQDRMDELVQRMAAELATVLRALQDLRATHAT